MDVWQDLKCLSVVKIIQGQCFLLAILQSFIKPSIFHDMKR